MRRLILIAAAASAASACGNPPPEQNTSAVEANAVDANTTENVDMNANADMNAMNAAEAATDTVGTSTYSGGDHDSEEVNGGDYGNSH